MNYVFKPTPYNKLFLRRVPTVAAWGTAITSYLFVWHLVVEAKNKQVGAPKINMGWFHTWTHNVGVYMSNGLRIIYWKT